jgi:hypothetical protein
MANSTNGGPAFPVAWPDPNPPERGMTLRDWFAGQALPSLIASAMNTKDSAWPVTVTEIAEKSYQFADAMLAERAKQA